MRRKNFSSCANARMLPDSRIAHPEMANGTRIQAQKSRAFRFKSHRGLNSKKLPPQVQFPVRGVRLLSKKVTE